MGARESILREVRSEVATKEGRQGNQLLWILREASEMAMKYEEWCEEMKDEITDEEITPEYYAFCCDNNLDDERANLNVEVDGYIVAFASLGLWNGRFNGAKLVGTNVRDILYSNDDYVTWYCDPYNVKAEMIHHDGTNYVIYRVARNKEFAEKLVNMIAYNGMTEEQFKRATKSLRPYVAKIYGW
jgi:NurA-like 5'-3' nuclease